MNERDMRILPEDDHLHHAVVPVAVLYVMRKDIRKFLLIALLS